ncbi:MAG: hypothetical protein ACREPG_00220 [Candidatus Binatia bacterium]
MKTPIGGRARAAQFTITPPAFNTPGEKRAFQCGYDVGFEHGRAEGAATRNHLRLAQAFNRYVGYSIALAFAGAVLWLVVKL